MRKENHPSWLVPFDIAKQLKEIGFDKPCIFSYSDLPAWGQVFEWFREKGLHSYIETCCTNLEEPRKQDSELLEKSITFYKYLKGKDAIGSFFFSRRECNLTFSYSTFLSYEEAQEALVKSLIEEYKRQIDGNK